MARKLSRRSPKSRFPLSLEAAALVLDERGRWEHVQLSDGDAAQGMVPGVKAKPPIFEAIPVEALDEAPEPESLPLPDFD
jgi:hypothetical protein